MWKNMSTHQTVKGCTIAINAGCESVMKPEKLERWPVTVAFVKDHGYLIEFVEHHEGQGQECRSKA